MKKHAIPLMTLAALVVALVLATTGCPNPSGAGADQPPSVAADTAALAIGYGVGDSAERVIGNLTLPSAGAGGSTIVWSSDTPAAVSATGVVSCPLDNTTVVLTATITNGTASDTKVFTLTVQGTSVAAAVASDKSALAIGFGGSDSAASVTVNLTLASAGANGSTIVWSSDTPAAVSATGVVFRSTDNTTVVLTATITKEPASDTKVFTLTVQGTSVAAAVASDKSALAIGFGGSDSAASVTVDLTLASAGANGSTIAWSSDNTGVVSNSGVVTLPGTDTVVTLTATITNGSASDTKQFALTVIGTNAAVASDKAALAVGFGVGDSAASVTVNLTLPSTGASGSTIAWSSDNTGIVTNGGVVVTLPATDTVVTLTATISKGSSSDTKQFALTVKQLAMGDWIVASGVSPGDGAIEVDLERVIRIPFNFALDASTVIGANFRIINTSTGLGVAITVAYDASSQTVSLTPTALYAQDTRFLTIATTGVKNAGGTNMPAQAGFYFTTLSYAEILSQWKFNGNGVDSSGHGNVYTNATGTYTASPVHEGTHSISYNGGQYGASNVDLGNQLTVTVWVNVADPIRTSLNTIMANAGAGESANGFKLCINNWNTSDRRVVIESGNTGYGGKYKTATGLVLSGTWYHLAFVIDKVNKYMKVYFNGVNAPLSFSSDIGTSEPGFLWDFKTSGPFTIGTFTDRSYGFKGSLDDMRVYNRVLSASEVAKIAAER